MSSFDQKSYFDLFYAGLLVHFNAFRLVDTLFLIKSEILFRTCLLIKDIDIWVCTRRQFDGQFLGIQNDGVKI